MRKFAVAAGESGPLRISRRKKRKKKGVCMLFRMDFLKNPPHIIRVYQLISPKYL
jgi:hypothetical protein